MGRGDDTRMVGQTKIIVGAKIDDALRLAVVSDGSAGIRPGEQFRLIQFDRPRAGLHPGGETWRGLQWVAAFAREEIAQAEFCRVFVHSLWGPVAIATLPYRGSHCTSGWRNDKG